VKLNGNGSFTFYDDDTVTSEGTFAIQGNKLTFATDTHCDAQGVVFSSSWGNSPENSRPEPIDIASARVYIVQ
jgi:hypothetical protein